jgi:hypothetical protein
MNASREGDTGGPAASNRAPEGSKKKELKGGSHSQHEHLQTIQNQLDAFVEAHPNSRVFAAVQSGYSNHIPTLFKWNIGTHYTKLKETFVHACTQRGGRLVAAQLHEDLVGLADPVLIAQVAERLVQLFIAAGLIGDKLGDLMIKCVAGGGGRGEGEQPSIDRCSNQYPGVQKLCISCVPSGSQQLLLCWHYSDHCT